jgi:pimeloyl-ACP methyl ester carboxylesterase
MADSTAPRHVEERGFLSNRRGRKLFYAVHGDPASRCAWLFCNPFLEEKNFSQSVYVTWARRIADEGGLAVRFDYEGDGDSEGTGETVGLRDWVDDAVAVAEFIRTQFRPEYIYLFGLRLGGSVACLAAQQVACAGLLLWDPVIKGEPYFQDCLKINLTTQLATYKRVTVGRKQLLERFAAGETVNIGGHEVSPKMAQEIGNLDISPLLEVSHTVVDVIQFQNSDNSGFAFSSSHSRGGSPVQIHLLPVTPFWREPREYDAGQISLLEASIAMLRARECFGKTSTDA